MLAPKTFWSGAPLPPTPQHTHHCKTNEHHRSQSVRFLVTCIVKREACSTAIDALLQYGNTLRILCLVCLGWGGLPSGPWRRRHGDGGRRVRRSLGCGGCRSLGLGLRAAGDAVHQSGIHTPVGGCRVEAPDTYDLRPRREPLPRSPNSLHTPQAHRLRTHGDEPPMHCPPLFDQSGEDVESGQFKHLYPLVGTRVGFPPLPPRQLRLPPPGPCNPPPPTTCRGLS